MVSFFDGHPARTLAGLPTSTQPANAGPTTENPVPTMAPQADAALAFRMDLPVGVGH